MNDFTKIQLKDLLKCVNLAEIDHGKSQRLDCLKRQLQLMIDNYCEQHEADEFENHDIYKHCDKRFR